MASAQPAAKQCPCGRGLPYPELRDADLTPDDSPRRTRPVVTIVALLCIVGLVFSVAAGFLSAF